MQEGKPPVAEVSYALSGEIDGQERRYFLSEGVNTVGRAGSCDVAIPGAGVSLRHAAIELTSSGVELRDLASKNGTFVDGKKAAIAKITAGQEIRFGGVSLRLEEIATEDAWLEIVARRKTGADGDRESDSATATVIRSGTVDTLAVRRSMRLYDDVTRTLAVGGASASDEALAIIVRGLGASGAVLVERQSGGTDFVFASYGKLPQRLPERIIRDALGRAAQSGEATVDGVSSAGEAWTVAASAEEEPVLLIAGAVAGDLHEQSMLQTMRRVFALARTQRRRDRTRQRAGSPKLRFPDDYVPGSSAAMEAVYRQLGSVANSLLPVLLVGETGVGKECLSRTIHRSSDRSSEVFLPVNCAAIPTELLEAELFGIEKGVATGVEGRKGRFLLADEGTLFLDEIGDMSLGLQAKLLRVLEEKAVRPVGGGSVPVDVRIIAATNTELEDKVRSGDFRRDLYFRLAGMVITVPPLRQRHGDLPGLIEFFFHEALERAGKNVSGITYGAMRRLAEKTWPGNVRQLRHVIHRLVFLCADGRPIDSAQVMGLDDHELNVGGAKSDDARQSIASWGDLRLSRCERLLIDEALRRTNGNRTRAARLLGISRQALHRRLR